METPVKQTDSIETLNLEVRTYNYFKRENIATIEEMREHIRTNRNHAPRFCAEGEKALAEYDKSKEIVIESDDRKRLDLLTERVKTTIKLINDFTYSLCTDLKEIHDNKLYKELGYEKFGDFTESEIGIGKRQAERLVCIAKNLTEDFATSMSQIGSTKLYMLSTLDEPARQEITQNTDLESTSVKELKEKIKSLEETNRKTCEHSKELEKQVEKLKEHPVQVTVEDTTKIQELEEQLKEAQEKYQSELEKVRKELSENRSQSLATFNAYLTSATNAMERLCDFVSVRMADENIKHYKQKIELLLRCVSSKINLGGD